MSNKVNIPYLGTFSSSTHLETLLRKTNVSTTGDASWPEWTKFDSTGEIIYKAPVRSIYFLFAPFPWDVKKLKHIIGVLDSFIYMYLVYLIILNIKNIWKDPILRIILILLLSYVFIFGFGVGNFGTGIRHKVKFTALFVLLAVPQIKKFIFFKKIIKLNKKNYKFFKKKFYLVNFYMKIIHIINSLRKGGAEGNLYRLSKFQKQNYQSKIKIMIVTLISDGFYEKELKKMDIKLWSLNLNKKKFFDIIKAIFILRKIIRRQNPDVIQSWMYHSNFITLFLPKIFYDRIFWGIRHTKLNLNFSKITTIILSLICGFFSKIIPKKIIYNSEASIHFHINKFFYSKNNTILINNGYSDRSYFSSNRLREKFRKKK